MNFLEEKIGYFKESEVNKIFMLGDPHLGVNSNSHEYNEIQYNYLTKYFIEDISSCNVNPQYDILVIMGDVFHQMESVNTRTGNLAIQIFDELTQWFKQIYIIIGNHDIYYRNRNDINSVRYYDRIYQNITLVENPSKLTINNINILLLPWVYDNSKLPEIINNDNFSQCEYLFAHLDINDFKLNDAENIKNGVDPKTLKSFNHVYSGHIHIRQQNKNITYVGTPYHLDRGDRNNKKGFYYLDLTNNNVTENFVENNRSPEYVRYDFDYIIELALNKIEELFHNNFIDIKVNNPNVTEYHISKIKKYLVDNINIRYLDFKNEFNFNNDSEESNKTIDEINLKTIFNEFVENNYNEQFSEDLKELFNSYYSET